MKPHILVEITGQGFRETKKLVIKNPGGALVLVDFHRPGRGDLFSDRKWEYCSPRRRNALYDLEPEVELRGVPDRPVQIIVNDWTLRLAAHVMGDVQEFVVQRGFNAPRGAKTGSITGSFFTWYAIGGNVQVDFCPIIPIRGYEQQVV